MFGDKTEDIQNNLAVGGSKTIDKGIFVILDTFGYVHTKLEETNKIKHQFSKNLVSKYRSSVQRF